MSRPSGTGILLSLLIFRQLPPLHYYAALLLMAVGAWLCANDTPLFAPPQNAAAVSE